MTSLPERVAAGFGLKKGNENRHTTRKKAKRNG
jgi:hypothetical protein